MHSLLLVTILWANYSVVGYPYIIKLKIIMIGNFINLISIITMLYTIFGCVIGLGGGYLIGKIANAIFSRGYGLPSTDTAIIMGGCIGTGIGFCWDFIKIIQGSYP